MVLATQRNQITRIEFQLRVAMKGFDVVNIQLFPPTASCTHRIESNERRPNLGQAARTRPLHFLEIWSIRVARRLAPQVLAPKRVRNPGWRCALPWAVSLCPVGADAVMVRDVPRVALRSTLGYLLMPRWGRSGDGL